MRRRRKVVELFLFALWGGILLELFNVQIFNWRHYQRLAAAQHYTKVKLLGERGKIYDRKGRLLALNRSCTSIQVLPKWVRDKDRLAALFADFGWGTFTTNRDFLSRDKGLFWFRRYIDYDIGDSLRKVLVKERFHNATLVNDDYERLYPYGEFCADIVGFVGSEGGLAGLEWEFNSLLAGKSGWVMMQRDAIGNSYPYPSHPTKQPERGADIQLTIDADIQRVCYEALKRRVNETGAIRGAVVVLDSTGAILALVDYPGYDPNRFADYPKELYKANAVTDQVEPGSSFKLVICAAALEAPYPERFTERLYDVSAGFIEIGQRKIKDVHPNGVLTFDSVFINSSNLGCALMSFDIAPELYYQVARRLGFSKPVGVGLPNEGRGRLDPPKKLRNRLRFATISFGQGVTVTLLQLAAAYLCIANDGKYVKPYLIESIRKGDRVIVNFDPVVARQAVKPQTAQRIKDILWRVVEHGTGKQAAIANVAVCGKTGTAQKVEPGGGYSSVRSLMTFIGFFPKEKPRYCVAVMIDEPKRVRFAAGATCPVFKEIGERLLLMDKIELAVDSWQRLESWQAGDGRR